MTPIYKIEANGKDITETLNKETSQIHFLDKAGNEADELTLTLEGEFKRPKSKDILKVWIGSVELGMFYCGAYSVNSASTKKGLSNQIEIKATSADFSSDIKVKRSKSYEKTNLKKIVEIIASRNSLGFSCDVDEQINHIQQTRESDLNFLKRIADDYNCIFAVKNKMIILKRKVKDGKKNDSFPVFNLIVDEQVNLNIHINDKEKYGSCKASWRDTKENKQKSVTVGTKKPLLSIKDSFSSSSEARAKAKAALEKANEGTKEGDISCIGFICYAGGHLNLSGTIEDDGLYSIETAQHTLNDQGWMLVIEIKN